MDLYLTEVDTGSRLSFCLLPSSIKAKTTGKFISYDFISLGEVQMPNGMKLCTYSWSGTFPGPNVKTLPFIKQSLYHTPKEMVDVIEKWRKNHTELILMLTETPLNVNVYLKSFTYTPTGGVGNYDYSLEFIEAKDVSVSTAEVTVTTTSTKSSNTATNTRATSTASKTTTYTVKSGDCLWNIAKALLGSGSRWTEIYSLNKSIIGSNPDLIYPGQVFTIPAS